MIRAPAAPSAPGAQSRYMRRVRDYNQQHQQMGHTSGAGDLTTQGFLPRRQRPSFLTSSELAEFRVETVCMDHLKCKRASRDSANVVTVSGETVRIAKPDELRVTGWNGGAGVNGIFYAYDQPTAEQIAAQPDFNLLPWLRRTATLLDASNLDFGDVITPPGRPDEIDIKESIWPSYVEGRSVILAAQMQSTVFTVTELADPNDPLSGVQYPLVWLDTNGASRRFEANYRKVQICVEGKLGTWFALIRTSEAFQEQ